MSMREKVYLKLKDGLGTVLLLMMVWLTGVGSVKAQPGFTVDDPLVLKGGEQYDVSGHVFKDLYASFTAPSDGVLTLSLSGTDLLNQYTDNTYTTLVEPRLNYVNNSCELEMKAGDTYYFGRSFLLNANSISVEFGKEGAALELKGVSPAEGNTDMPEVLVKNSFYVMIVGPQDGTKWALMAQLDRIDYPDPERNTAYFVPTVGEYAGQVRQYVLQDQTGQAFNYASSLDIHQFVATPYMIMSKNGTDVIEDTNYDFNATGEVRDLLISDWLGGSSNGVSITATVSNSSHGDWFSVTQPVAAEGKSNLFAITLTAQAKPFNVKGRRATLTLTDNKGFSRDLTIYQGDRSAADDALSVEAVNASGRVDVTAAGEGFDVIYPSSYNRLDVYATSGQLVGTYALSAGGSAHIAAASWQKGIYVFQFAGNEGTQVVKVLKK